MDAADANASAVLQTDYYRAGALKLDGSARMESPGIPAAFGGGFADVPFSAAVPQEYAYPEKPVYEAIKRLFDVLFSIVAMIAAFPIMLITAIAIKLEDGGPVIYKRACVGRQGKPYDMYKFRSMVVGAEGLTEQLFTPEQKKKYQVGDKFKDDPRITKVGRLLRKSSVDELPQLICVLKNDMSLIGPRPVTKREAATYGAAVFQLLSAKPGITGYWQVYGRDSLPYLSAQAREFQLHYVKHSGFLLDLKLFFLTIKAVLFGKGAR